MEKKPFDIETALPRIADAIAPYPKAGLFTLMEEGYRTPFAILVACILSIRTLDEVMLPASRRLFARAATPARVATLPLEELTALIADVGFAPGKARQIAAMATRLTADYEGQLPCDRELMLSFAGVGPKCANLAISIACGEPFIGVDVHVHRVTNRWGYVQTRTPEATLAVLEAKLPQKYWIDLNRLIMPFGKFICTGIRPHCSTCPLMEMCPQIGVV